LAFTDADCIPAADWLARGVAALEVGGGVDMVGGRVQLFFRSERPRGLAERYEALTAFPQEHYVAKLHFAVTANLFVRRPVLEALQGFDAVLQSGGDRDFGQRARAAGYRLIYASSVVVDHPARASLAELVGKAKRVVGGKMAMWQHGKIRFSARDWFNFVVPPVVWTWRLLVDRHCPWRMSERLVVILVRYVLHLAVLPVRLRVLLECLGRERRPLGSQ
jgi:GT2 family glycosyltransferase